MLGAIASLLCILPCGIAAIMLGGADRPPSATDAGGARSRAVPEQNRTRVWPRPPVGPSAHRVLIVFSIIMFSRI